MTPAQVLGSEGGLPSAFLTSVAVPVIVEPLVPVMIGCRGRLITVSGPCDSA